jgi:hypothetical protein
MENKQKAGAGGDGLIIHPCYLAVAVPDNTYVNLYFVFCDFVCQQFS